MAWDVAAIAATAPGAAFQVQPFETDGAMAAPDAPVTGSAFYDVMQREVGDLAGTMNAAENGLRALAAGKPVELHEVMIGLERARMSVQVFVQVRNRLVEAWQDLMRMQV
jgi:flagellar hook-basal body complex protein FliE